MAAPFDLHGMGARAPMTSLRQLVEDYERRLILAALERARGNQRRAAAELGCLPTTLNEKMRRLGLRACDKPPASGSDAGSGAGEAGLGGLEMVGHA
jgi:DNA-binding NtrC family response regulator